MSIKIESFALRLNKVEQVIRPVGSLKARIADLHPEHLSIYNAWKKRSEEYNNKYEGNVYEALLAELSGAKQSYSPPILPSYVANKLYQPVQLTNNNPYETYIQLLESL